MATTLPGSPYVESSDLVAGYPGVSESLAERVDTVGVLPFADSTARGTALPSPTDGQYSYLQDTNATEYYNGSAWVAAGVAPGLVHINTTTFSAVSSVSVDDCFTSDYQNYRLVLSLVPTSAGNLNMRLRVGGVDASSADYDYIRVFVYAAGTVAGARSLSVTSFFGGYFPTVLIGTCSADIFGPNLTASTQYSAICGSAQELGTVMGELDLATSYDGLTLTPSAGTITGTLRIYGYKNGA